MLEGRILGFVPSGECFVHGANVPRWELDVKTTTGVILERLDCIGLEIMDFDEGGVLPARHLEARPIIGSQADLPLLTIYGPHQRRLTFKGLALSESQIKTGIPCHSF